MDFPELIQFCKSGCPRFAALRNNAQCNELLVTVSNSFVFDMKDSHRFDRRFQGPIMKIFCYSYYFIGYITFVARITYFLSKNRFIGCPSNPCYRCFIQNDMVHITRIFQWKISSQLQFNIKRWNVAFIRHCIIKRECFVVHLFSGEWIATPNGGRNRSTVRGVDNPWNIQWCVGQTFAIFNAFGMF